MPTISLAQKHADLDQHNAKQLAQFARESGDHLLLETGPGRNPAGHEKVLRAIPIIAKGISGTIPTTNPARSRIFSGPDPDQPDLKLWLLLRLNTRSVRRTQP